MEHTVLSNKMVRFFKESGVVKNIEQGEFLFREGDVVNGLYMILSGEAKISKLSNNGTQLTLRHAKSGHIAVELALLDHQPKYLASAQMISDGTVAILAKELLKDLLKNNGEFALELIQMIGEYVRRDQTRFRDLVLYGKKGALYSTLIRLSNSYGHHHKEGIFIDIYMTDQKLAEFCGTSRESINRLMSKLRKEKVISTEKSYITIHHLDYLKEAINCAECPVDLCTIH